MSWGHDEYLYHVVKDYLPDEALAMIRYHSFYAAHREEAYTHLMNEDDRRRLEWVRAFNPYDLYSKGHQPPDVEALRPYYEDLDRRVLPRHARLVRIGPGFDHAHHVFLERVRRPGWLWFQRQTSGSVPSPLLRSTESGFGAAIDCLVSIALGDSNHRENNRIDQAKAGSRW